MVCCDYFQAPMYFWMLISAGSLELCIPYSLHQVIVRGIERRTIVDDFADRNNFVKHPAELSSATKTGIYAWALMTNHA